MSKVTIICEIGINHNGDMELAKELILSARECGCDYAKFQLYDVDELFSDKKIETQNRNWYDEVKKTQLSKEQTFMLAEFCGEIGIKFLASAFDSERVGWLDEIGVDYHKIGCRLYRDELWEGESEIGPTVTKMCMSGIPIIMSVPYGEERIWLPECTKPTYYLYCIPEYPTDPNKIPWDDIEFGTHGFDGFSCHCPGIYPAVRAIDKGAYIIEKHFTFDRLSKEGPDHICSIEPKEMGELVYYAKNKKSRHQT